MSKRTNPTTQVPEDHDWDGVMSAGFGLLIELQATITDAITAVDRSAGDALRARAVTTDALRRVAHLSGSAMA